MDNSISVTNSCSRSWRQFYLMAAVLVLYSSYAASAGMALKLSIDKSEYFLGEPIYARVSLENTGSEALNVPYLFDIESGDIQILVIRPDGRQFGYVPLALLDSDYAPVKLAPKSSMTTIIPIFYGGRGWSFTAPGTYSLRAIYEPKKSGDKAISNKVTITVRKEESEAGKYLFDAGHASDEAGMFLVWQSGDHLRAGIAHLENLTDKYPNSILNNYIWLAIGKNLGRQFKDYSVNRLRQPKYDESDRYLNKVKDNMLPRSLVVRKYLTLANNNIEQKKYAAAKEMLAKSKELMDAVSDIQSINLEYDQLNKRLNQKQ